MQANTTLSQRNIALFLGLLLAAVIGIVAINGDDSPEIGGLTPLAPQGAQEEGSDEPLFIDDEPVTPFDGSSSKGMPVPGSDVDETIVEVGSGMAVPGYEGDEMVVEVGSGMAVPGYEGDVEEMVVENDG